MCFFYNFKIPPYINYCMDILTGSGFKAYLVGGCVRDFLLGIIPHDYDIASSALPEDIAMLFKKTVFTGLKFGTVQVIIDSSQIDTLTKNEKFTVEITTLRKDGDYYDFRHPDKIYPTNNIAEDLSRRDFTINAMAYSKHDGLIDPFNGVNDLNQQLIKLVGNSHDRFYEDPLRILRAFRFSSALNFNIEDKTLNAALDLSPLLKKISLERITAELLKTLSSKMPSRLSILIYYDALNFLNINPVKDIKILDKLNNNSLIRLTALIILSDSSPQKVCSVLKLSSRQKSTVLSLFEIMQISLPKTKFKVKHLLNNFGADIFIKYLHLNEILYNHDISIAKNLFDRVILNNEPFKLTSLDINGYDLISAGISNKKDFSFIFSKLLRYIMYKPEWNNKNILLNLVKKFYN